MLHLSIRSVRRSGEMRKSDIVDTICLAMLFVVAVVVSLTIDSVGRRVVQILNGSFFNYVFIGWLVLGLLLEFVIPARREERSNPMGLIADFIWTGIKLFAFAVILIPLSAFVGGAISELFDDFGIRFWVSTNSPLVNVLLAMLLSEFLFYWSHRLRHTVPLFWRFHSVHHSQKRLNVLTCHRTHPLDDLVHLLLIAVPGALFSVSAEWLATMLLLITGYTRFYHANIRISLGPLRHILVSPQFHRFHHSAHPDHADKNFGLVLSIWDRLFGTFMCPPKVYPKTGVTDFGPPVETAETPISEIPTLVWRQLTLRPRG